MRILALATLITAVLAAPAPTPSEGDAPVEFTSENFKEQLASTDLWWIKFFSPYCHHCKDFAPTWDALYEEYKDKPHLKFGNVNCVTQGDLCNQEDILAYPAISLYKEGKSIDSQKANTRVFFEQYIEGKLKEVGGDEDDKEDKADKTEDKKKDAKVPATAVNGHFPKFPASTDEVNEKYPGVEKAAEPEATGTNPHGVSVELNHKEFTRRVTATRDSWFIQFYSPTSSYSRDIQPAWKHMAVKAQGKLHIGQVNCDVEKELCKEAGATEMPTLKYFASSMSSEYKGLRGLGDLLQFLERAVDARTPEEINLADYVKLVKSTEEEGDVTFVYLYDKATSSEDFQALEKLAVSIVGTVKIVKSSDPKLVKELEADHLPALFAVSADKVTAYPSQASHEIRDHNQLMAWAKENRSPLVPQMTPFNSADLFSSHMVVLAILDPRDERDTRAALKELRVTARELQKIMAKDELEELEELRKKKQLKIEEAKDKGDKKAEEQASKIRVKIADRQRISVAWIDGVFWERWVKSRYGSNEGHTSRIIIQEESTGKYWDRNWGHGILLPSRTQILETLKEIASPSPRVRYQTLRGPIANTVLRARNYVLEHQLVSVLIFVLVVGAVFYKRRGRRPSNNSVPSEGLLGKFD